MQITQFDVKLRLTEDMLGTVPKNREVYKTYIESKAPVVEGQEDEAETVEEVEERGWTGFHEDERGLFIYDYMIKGFLKNAGNILKGGALEREKQIKALRSKIENVLFILPRRIYLGCMKPAGVLERPLRAMTAQGPRVSLARSDVVPFGTEIEFTVKLVKNAEVTEALVMELFEYGALCGLGQWRNGGWGRFEVVK